MTLTIADFDSEGSRRWWDLKHERDALKVRLDYIEEAARVLVSHAVLRVGYYEVSLQSLDALRAALEKE